MAILLTQPSQLLLLVHLVVIHDVQLLLPAPLDVVSASPVPIHRGWELGFFHFRPPGARKLLGRFWGLVGKPEGMLLLRRTLFLLQQLLIVQPQEALGWRGVAGQDGKVFFLTAVNQCGGWWGSRRQRRELAVHAYVRRFLSFPWLGGWSWSGGAAAAVWPEIKNKWEFYSRFSRMKQISCLISPQKSIDLALICSSKCLIVLSNKSPLTMV